MRLTTSYYYNKDYTHPGSVEPTLFLEGVSEPEDL